MTAFSGILNSVWAAIVGVLGGAASGILSKLLGGHLG